MQGVVKTANGENLSKEIYKTGIEIRKSNIESLRNNIGKAAKGKTQYLGFYFDTI